MNTLLNEEQLARIVHAAMRELSAVCGDGDTLVPWEEYSADDHKEIISSMTSIARSAQLGEPLASSNTGESMFLCLTLAIMHFTKTEMSMLNARAGKN